MSQNTLSFTERHKIELMHDARAVHDTALLRFSDFKVNGMPSWVLAIVKPDPDSGAATVPGGYIRAESGEFVTPEGSSAVVLKKGVWQVIVTTLIKQPQRGTYSWSEPLGQKKRVLTPEDHYSLFTYGGTIVFKPIPGAQGIEQFRPVHLLFTEWGEFVQPAFDLSIKSEILHGKLIPDEAIAGLSQLVYHENRLIATIAFRELIKYKTAPQFLSEFPGSADDHSRSLFTYIMIAMSSPDIMKDFVRSIEGRLQETWQMSEIQSIALGAFAAILFHPGEAEVIARGRAVLIAARQRLYEIIQTIEPDPKLLLMFTIMGIK